MGGLSDANFTGLGARDDDHSVYCRHHRWSRLDTGYFVGRFNGWANGQLRCLFGAKTGLGLKHDIDGHHIAMATKWLKASVKIGGWQ